MEEPRKIVLVLGNGFDLDLGLKTSYKDFWESEFCPKTYPAPIIHHLNQRWPDNLEAVKWYDLENELLNYYNNLRDPNLGTDIITKEEKDFLEEYSNYGYACGWYDDKVDLLQSLVNKGVFIYTENSIRKIHERYKEDALESPIWRDRKALQLIKDGLCRYLTTIQPSEDYKTTLAYLVLAYLDKEAINGNFVSIYSFNYTPVIIMGRKPDAAQVYHLHGTCDEEKIIIGTRDDQIYTPSYDFLQKSFDPDYNPPALVDALKDCDEAIFFGHSIGENDRQYFKAFFKQQTDYLHSRRKDITIFTRDDESEIQIKRSLQSMTDSNLSTLYGLNNIQIIKSKNVKKDQDKLLDFFVKHGVYELDARTIIGKLPNR